MSDHDQILGALAEHHATGEPIPDAAARMIGAAYHNGQASPGYSFSSTGAISDADALLSDLFTGTDPAESGPERAALAHYLEHRVRRGETGPVPDWSALWLEGARS